jgi:predicted nucleotidyltransferase
MLSLDKVDLGLLSSALEDHSPTMQWWLDPRTGEAIPKSEDLGWGEYADVDPDALIAIEPIDSGEAYGDMEEFVASVRDPAAQDLLSRAIAGRGAFRRFKDTLLEFPALREDWHAFHDARMRRRAIEWLTEADLLNPAEAVKELARIETQEQLPPPALHPRQIAAKVAEELRGLYGERLRQVLLFGSWARGDAVSDSDLDLLVVLDRVEQPWSERQQMAEILWRHSYEGDIVVTVLPVGEAEFENSAEPVLIRARKEGLAVA